MDRSSAGQIHLADQRGIIEQDGLTRWATFNHGGYFSADRKAFGTLVTLNDELFAPSHSEVYLPKQNSWVVIVPITGEVGIRTRDLMVDVGQVQLLFVQAGESVELSNPYADERINFLYLEFSAADHELLSYHAQLFGFDLEGKQNTLVPIVAMADALPFSMHIGMFDGRADTIYQLQNTGGSFYAFVVAGAFELQGRLLHQRDGLALWDLQEADMEALSNNAVVLIIELKL